MERNIDAVIRHTVESCRQQDSACDHIHNIQVVSPGSTLGCEECLKIGDRWVHLRLCLTCGNVGCCDSSKNKHARRHAAQSGHAVVMSFEPYEDWVWCYQDDILMYPE
jgi:uncharacterized UBP type Zn finger protein